MWSRGTPVTVILVIPGNLVRDKKFIETGARGEIASGQTEPDIRARAL